jgi:hypothetical protein
MQATNMNFFPHYLTIGRSILWERLPRIL